LDRKLAESMVAAVAPPSPSSSPSQSIELVILPHHAVYDGRGSFANSAWLQELPDPVSRIVWGNSASISPATASRLGLAEADLVEVAVGGAAVRLPVVIQRGMADDVVATTLGHGHTAGGVVAVEAGGANLAALLGRQDPRCPRVAVGVTLKKVGPAAPLAVVRTQKERRQHGRAIALAGSLAEYRRDPAFASTHQHLPPPGDTFPPYDYSKGPKWGIAIDLSACVGCGACATACQVENNIAVVGRDQCQRGRQMHWLRIDRYEDGPLDDPDIHFQPMLCQHCDTAPCESVCPVNATSHSGDGLNEMVYNRCVGTRYCQNNCPYKVRRFNFLRYGQFPPREPAGELAYNPRVTVRGVGVMEKCTFCVHRIKQARYEAYQAGAKIPDGRIQTACQRACPAGAIVFGDQNDPAGRLGSLIRSPRSYRVLAELNTKPNVFYLARVDNPAAGPRPGDAASQPARMEQGDSRHS
jgi:molybdopterin-containing oxidoreductase family iron-sulfur binding subunit